MRMETYWKACICIVRVSWIADNIIAFTQLNQYLLVYSETFKRQSLGYQTRCCGVSHGISYLKLLL